MITAFDTSTITVIVAALLLDHWLGEPQRYHPLVGFGWLAARLEKELNLSEFKILKGEFKTLKGEFKTLSGAVAVAILTLPLVSLACWVIAELNSSAVIEYKLAAWLIQVLALYWAIGNRSLRDHVLAVKQALLHQNLDEARSKFGYIVSRDTAQSDRNQIVNGTIETTLENGNDAVFAPIFWFCIVGAPGVIAYRLINTLDAMWGYKNERYIAFGKVAARADDVLNFVPARLVAITYALLGNAHQGFRCWSTQAKLLDSPNAGPVMTSGAGSLDLLLGGPAHYHGSLVDKPTFGGQNTASSTDIDKALALIHGGLIFWCACISLISIQNI